MRTHEVSFSIASHAAWAPNIGTAEAWAKWAEAPYPIVGKLEPGLAQMPPMLRRRAGFLGKMALDVAYRCLDGRTGIPTIFCSRHGEASRGVELLTDLAQQIPLSPTGFGLAVHNASAGLFSIARADHANHLALAAGNSTVEHAVIEACSLLADGVPEVLLVAYDDALPDLFAEFSDCAEQPHAWAWLMVSAKVPTGAESLHLTWEASTEAQCADVDVDSIPASLELLQFYLRGDHLLERITNRRRWRWTRDA